MFQELDLTSTRTHILTPEEEYWLIQATMDTPTLLQ